MYSKNIYFITDEKRKAYVAIILAFSILTERITYEKRRVKK